MQASTKPESIPFTGRTIIPSCRTHTNTLYSSAVAAVALSLLIGIGGSLYGQPGDRENPDQSQNQNQNLDQSDPLRTETTTDRPSFDVEPGATATIALEGPAGISENGSYALRWQAEDPLEASPGQWNCILSELDDAGHEKHITVSGDRATHISGRPDGSFSYRVLCHDGTSSSVRFSNAVTVEVKHHSLGKALAFLGAGAVVFLATAFLILGNRRRSEDNG